MTATEKANWDARPFISNILENYFNMRVLALNDFTVYDLLHVMSDTLARRRLEAEEARKRNIALGTVLALCCFLTGFTVGIVLF